MRYQIGPGPAAVAESMSRRLEMCSGARRSDVPGRSFRRVPFDGHLLTGEPVGQSRRRPTAGPPVGKAAVVEPDPNPRRGAEAFGVGDELDDAGVARRSSWRIEP